MQVLAISYSLKANLSAVPLKVSVSKLKTRPVELGTTFTAGGLCVSVMLCAYDAISPDGCARVGLKKITSVVACSRKTLYLRCDVYRDHTQHSYTPNQVAVGNSITECHRRTARSLRR